MNKGGVFLFLQLEEYVFLRVNVPGLESFFECEDKTQLTKLEEELFDIYAKDYLLITDIFIIKWFYTHYKVEKTSRY